MARFQALTNPLLDAELEQLRQEMGLRENQKAELLREMAAITSWVFAQARAGRSIEARGPDRVEELRHPALRARQGLAHVVLSAEEAERLITLMDAETWPNPRLAETLAHLKDPERVAPELRWSKEERRA